MASHPYYCGFLDLPGVLMPPPHQVDLDLDLIVLPLNPYEFTVSSKHFTGKCWKILFQLGVSGGKSELSLTHLRNVDYTKTHSRRFGINQKV